MFDIGDLVKALPDHWQGRGPAFAVEPNRIYKVYARTMYSIKLLHNPCEPTLLVMSSRFEKVDPNSLTKLQRALYCI